MFLYFISLKQLVSFKKPVINGILLFYVRLEAKAVIEGPSEMYIKAGSKLKLFCRYYNITERPTAVFW